MAKRTFFDQWHRIAGLRIGLRASVSVRLHHYRDEAWHVYYDPSHNGFFRARPDTHRLILEITPERTLSAIWRDFVDQSPATAPGQEDFFELISALYRANLIFIEGNVSETRLLERALKKKKKPLPARVSELLFYRIPLWDPEPFLQRNEQRIKLVYSWPVILCACILFAWAGTEFVIGAKRAFEQSSGILQANNLVSLFLATFFAHFFHELSHAALCKYFGGHVRTMGVMLLMFSPLPYADVSASWSFRSPWQRAMVGAAGMYADMIFCSISVIIWAYSPPGLVNELALNLMFVTAVYTFVFNINPLMRFDGYYILSDVTAIPNLHTAAKTQFDAGFRKLFLREPFKPNERVTPRRRMFLISFFICSFIYRNMVMIGIVLFVSDQYFGLGLLAAVALAYNSFVVPLIKLLKPLGNPQFMSKHKVKLRIAFAGFLVLVGVICFVPLPHSRHLDGVVEAYQKTRIFIPYNGIVDQVLVQSGQVVSVGQVLVILTNPELTSKHIAAEQRLRGARLRADQAITRDSVELAAIQQEIATIVASLSEMDEQAESLTLRATQDGIWTAQDIQFRTGSWMQRGAEIGRISDDGKYQFQAILQQNSAREIGLLDAQSVSVKIEGARTATLDVTELKIIPYSRRDLPSAALTPLGGGSIAISTENPDQPQTVERFFLVTAVLADDPTTLQSVDGRSGWLRMTLTPKPILARTVDAVRQFFQQRYKI